MPRRGNERCLRASAARDRDEVDAQIPSTNFHRGARLAGTEAGNGEEARLDLPQLLQEIERGLVCDGERDARIVRDVDVRGAQRLLFEAHAEHVRVAAEGERSDEHAARAKHCRLGQHAQDLAHRGLLAKHPAGGEHLDQLAAALLVRARFAAAGNGVEQLRRFTPEVGLLLPSRTEALLVVPVRRAVDLFGDVRSGRVLTLGRDTLIAVRRTASASTRQGVRSFIRKCTRLAYKRKKAEP